MRSCFAGFIYEITTNVCFMSLITTNLRLHLNQDLMLESIKNMIRLARYRNILRLFISLKTIVSHPNCVKRITYNRLLLLECLFKVLLERVVIQSRIFM